MAHTRRATRSSPDPDVVRDAQEQVALLTAFLVTAQHFPEGGPWTSLFDPIPDPRAPHLITYPLGAVLFAGTLLFLCRLGSRRQVTHLLRRNGVSAALFQALLVAALPDLVARTDLDAMHLDGGYNVRRTLPGNGADADDTAQALGVTLHYTAIRGGPPGSLAQWLAQLTWVRDDQDQPVAVITPEGHRLDLQPGRQEGRYIIQVSHDWVEAAPAAWQTLPLRWRKRTAIYALYLEARQITVAEHRHRVAHQRLGDKHLRPAVEATVRSVKHPFAGGQAPVRGRIRLDLMLTASSAMTNIRRLWRYERDQEAASATTPRSKGPAVMRRVFNYLRRWWHTYLSGPFQAMFDTQPSLSVTLA